MNDIVQYKLDNGFTQENIYEFAGAKDCVATLTLRQESAKVYGELLTVLFVYSSRHSNCIFIGEGNIIIGI